MALELKNRVRDTTATTGTGTYTLDETPPNGFQGFDAIATGKQIYYGVVLNAEFEVGIGVLTVGGTVTLTRATILDSSNSGAAVNWGAGDKDIFVVSIAQALEAFLYNGSGVDATLAAIAADSLTLGTALAIAQGGTGAVDAAAARTALGLVLGTDIQAFDADLLAIAALGVTDGNFMVGDGAAWVAEDPATVRTTLGLGALALAGATIDGDDWSGTDLAVADGGTGASDAAGAQANLGVPPNARDIATSGGISGGGDLSGDRTHVLANSVQGRVKGRAAGAGTGGPTDLTPAQLQAVLQLSSAYLLLQSEGTFTGTLTGVAGTPTATFRYHVTTNGMVFLTLEGTSDLSGTSDDTALGVSGLPSAIQPAGVHHAGLQTVLDNGALTTARVTVAVGGTVVLARIDGTGFTASGTTGLKAGFTVMYQKD